MVRKLINPDAKEIVSMNLQSWQQVKSSQFQLLSSQVKVKSLKILRKWGQVKVSMT